MARKRKPKPAAEPRNESEAAILARVVQEMAERSGRHVKPELLVEEAADPKHPLHHRFPWDNDIAGHRHRVDIARRLIASVRLVVRHSYKKIESVAYVRDSTLPPNETGYMSVLKLRTERQNAETTLELEVNRISAALERAKELAAALDLEHEFEELWAAAQRLQSRLRKGRPHLRDGDGVGDRPTA